MTFLQLNLHSKIIEALVDAGYSEPTEIQSKAIPQILNGFDIRASAQTGTGKTAAFLLPALNRLQVSVQGKRGGPRILVLAPTRELAMQIASQADKYSKKMQRTNTVCVVGGMPYYAQMRQLSRPYDILIATPGRLIDYINRRKIDLSRVEMLVLDEADRMLDMGFIKPIEEIVAATPSSRQTLLFSATLKGSVLKLSEKLLNKPVDVIVRAARGRSENIMQYLYYVDDLRHKNRLLDHILKDDEMNHAIIFTSTKLHAEKLVNELKDKGHQAAALHGDMNQRRRSKTIMQLRDGKLKFLVATDVAARGIDVPSITHVINFDLPRDAEDYVHRIGRTGRAKASGKALSFVAGNEGRLVKKIEQFTGQKIAIAEVKGLEYRGRSSAPKQRVRHDPRQKRKLSTPHGHFKRRSKAAASGRSFRSFAKGRRSQS